jgi:aryl-alcohol dehydrogenase-like predicted oxidoreductase
MEQRLLGRTGTFVSELCLGTMTFAREADEATSAKLLDRYLEAGGNFIDTADVYADTRSEEVLGRLLRGRRDEVVLATKGHFATGGGVNDRGSSRLHLTSAIEASLRRLQTDRIDLYQVHSWDAYTPVEETLATLDDLVHQGKARYLGISNFTGWQVAKATGLQRHHGWAPLVTIQPQYSLITRDIEREVLPAALDAGLGVLPWGPLGGGFLSGKYHRDRPPPPDSRISTATDDMEEAWARRATERNWAIVNAVQQVAEQTGHSMPQVAINWLLTRKGVTAPILGARTLEQLEDNLGAVGWRLEPAHLERLDAPSRLELEYPARFLAGADRFA